MAFRKQSSPALPEVEIFTGEEGEKHVIQVTMVTTMSVGVTMVTMMSVGVTMVTMMSVGVTMGVVGVIMPTVGTSMAWQLSFIFFSDFM